MNSLKVLIIDDDEISHKILTSILCDTFSLDHLYSGKGLLDYCIEHSPDLILLDMGLDEISGLDVIKLLHNNQDTS